MTAVEALRRARATRACADEVGSVAGCDLEHDFSTGDELIDEDPRPGEGMSAGWHRAWSSALLDGFSVEEVTAAEHTTDQPHE